MNRISIRILSAVLFLTVHSTRSWAGGSPKTENQNSSTITASGFKALKARSIGPAVMGGRVSSITLDPEDIYTYYVGLGTGGVMKTANNGASFDAIFEKEDVAAVGAIAVAPSNPKHVWVGTGEANDRNSSSWGNGVYHSSDGGGNWTNTGLRKSKSIPRIIVHPTDTNTVWVATMGDLWVPSPDRGLYKTTDGGKTWKLILAAPRGLSDRVGCGDIVIDPTNPNILYAVLYARMRTPWSFTAGPAASDGNDVGGIYKTIDGGSTWKKLENGLPKETGRIGLDVYLKNPKIVYAVVQSDEGGTSDIDDVHSKHGGVFRSEDGGESWTRESPLDPRPFYFSQIRIDPTNDQKIFVLGYMVHVSEDGGKTFREDYFDKVHPDCHALAIDPKNTKRLLLGTDGGIYQSLAGGKGWEFLNKFAAGEFYRITTDLSTPYRIAGGLQDNLNWIGPSKTRTKDGILNSDWINIGGGDGFYCVFDPLDSNIVYAESQEGYVHRLNLRTGEFKGLRPQPAEGQQAFRFHWNSPLIGSLHEPGTLYLGGNHVFKLISHGESWQEISPDLSTQDPKKIMTIGSGAENYGVVYALAESPIISGLLWAGTDDGKLWQTSTDGKKWTDITDKLPKNTKGQWINRIELSHFDTNVAYIAIDAHRSGNYSPLLYRTENGGKSWESISSNLPDEGPVKVIREDPINRNLLFTGSEFALFMSIDQGNNWIKFGDLPTVAVDDILIHARDHDLIIATHGRSLYIVDDIQPLEEMTNEIGKKDAYLFTPRPASGYYPLQGTIDWDGSCTYRGTNPPEGVIFNVYIKEFIGEGAKLSITNTSGQTVANISLAGTPGINRASWDLKISKEFLNDYGGEGQKFVRPGDYTVSLSYGKTKQTQKFHIDIAEGIETR
jgi:photosystem II stability/assembly factor-like uncharacterized protein